MRAAEEVVHGFRNLRGVPRGLLDFSVSVGHWHAQTAVTRPRKPCRFDSCPMHCFAARSSNGSGCLVLSQAIGVRLPYGLLLWPSGGMADASGSEPDARTG